MAHILLAIINEFKQNDAKIIQTVNSFNELERGCLILQINLSALSMHIYELICYIHPINDASNIEYYSFPSNFSLSNAFDIIKIILDNDCVNNINKSNDIDGQLSNSNITTDCVVINYRKRHISIASWQKIELANVNISNSTILHSHTFDYNSIIPNIISGNKNIMIVHPIII